MKLLSRVPGRERFTHDPSPQLANFGLLRVVSAFTVNALGWWWWWYNIGEEYFYGGASVSPPALSQPPAVSSEAGDSGTRNVLGPQHGHQRPWPSRFLRTEPAQCFLYSNSLTRKFYVKFFINVRASLCFMWLISPFLCCYEFFSLVVFFFLLYFSWSSRRRASWTQSPTKYFKVRLSE